MEGRRKVLQSRLKSLSQRNSAAFDSTTLYNSALELSHAILNVLRSPTASADTKRAALTNFIRSIVVDKKGNVIINYMPPGLAKVVTQSDGAPPSEQEKTGGVVTQSARNPLAPPVDPFSGLQHFGLLQ